jgi:hypothetical protein
VCGARETRLWLFLAVVTGRRWGRSDAEGCQVRLNAVR